MAYGGQVQMGMATGGYPMIPGAIGVMKHGKLKMKGARCCHLVLMCQFVVLLQPFFFYFRGSARNFTRLNQGSRPRNSRKAK
jgi:hypothetical protein